MKTAHRYSLFLLALTYLSFVSLGLPDGLTGVAWPSIRVSFNLPLDALGSLLVMFTTGYLVSTHIFFILYFLFVIFYRRSASRGLSMSILVFAGHLCW